MKKYFGIAFSIIIVIFSILFIVSPKDPFSENENRYLEEFPGITFNTLADGSFMISFEKYIQDHFPLRDAFVKLKTDTELALGKTENNGVYIASDGYLIEKNTYIEDNRLNRISSMINVISKGSDYHTTVMIVPTSITLNQDLLPKYATEYSETDRIKSIYSKLENCDTIDLYNELKELKNNNIQAYYKLDHHWTTRAAYEVYRKFINSINEEPLALDKFKEEIVSDSFLGTTFSKAALYNVTPDSITTYTNVNTKLKVTYVRSGKVTDSLYNKDYLNKKDKYAMFLDENQGLVIVENESMKSGKNLLVIKDSYANSFVPFVVNNFKYTHVIDPRYYSSSITEYIKENNIDEVLFLYNIHTLVTDQGIFNIK